jgi:hypothetical protein
MKDGAIFVFGSNLAGRHGKGAALTARLKYGAITGQGVGLMGQCYAIPTKGFHMETLQLKFIKVYIDLFIDFAKFKPEINFFVTAIGTGLAGYRHNQIAPMFKGVPNNCDMPQEWLQYL